MNNEQEIIEKINSLTERPIASGSETMVISTDDIFHKKFSVENRRAFIQENLENGIGGKDYVIKEVNITDIMAGQKNVFKSDLLRYAGASEMPTPFMMNFSGEHVVMEGNHRVAINILRGDLTVKAWVKVYNKEQ